MLNQPPGLWTVTSKSQKVPAGSCRATGPASMTVRVGWAAEAGAATARASPRAMMAPRAVRVSRDMVRASFVSLELRKRGADVRDGARIRELVGCVGVGVDRVRSRP